jgi:anti-anti-sigma factor
MTVATVGASAENGSVRISLGGDIDRANVAAVEERIHAVVSGPFTAVSVDLTDVTYIDSAGKRLLFDLASQLQESHILLLMGCQDSNEVSPLELVLPAQPWSLKNIRDAMRRWLSAVGAEPPAVADLLIAVGEACTNVIDHAYGADGGVVTVHLELQFPDVVVTIGDTGQWGLAPVWNRGRGTLFMRNCSDDVRIDHGATGTTVVIRRHLFAEATR